MRSLRSIHSMASRLAVTSAAVSLLTLLVAAPAAADAQDEAIIVTFSNPFEVPGMTLPAGTYKFKQLDAQATEQIIQIFNEDESKLFTTVQTVPVRRIDPNGDVVIRFAATDPGTPPAIKAYFYPGRAGGFQFVYPDEQAKAIASKTKTLVLSSDQEDVTPEALRTATLRVVNERGDYFDYSAGAIDWRDDTWENRPRVVSGEKVMAEDAGRSRMMDKQHSGMMTAADQRELVNDTAAIVSSALDQAGTSAQTVTISRDDLEKVHSNLESLRRMFDKGHSSSDETD
jgi:hypothetical protein